MAAIDFPNSPSVNDVFDVAGKKWLYDGSSWNLIAVAVTAGVTSLNGNTGVITGIATLASPTFTGTPTLPTGTIATTQTISDSSTKVATTAFVATAVSTGLITSSATAPVSPSAGNLWFNTSTGASFIYYNSAWVELGGGTMSPYQATSSTRPSSPWTGQTIYETDTNTNLQYNGSAWVCITPKGASVLTDQSTSSASFADLATAGPSVTINTGSSALITVSATTYRATGTGNTGMLGVNVSGATTMAASTSYGSRVSYTTAAYSHVLGSSFVLTGLTPGSNTFKLQYSVDGGTVNFLNRYITVIGIP